MSADRDRRAALAASFGAAAAPYARARPGYPPQALDWLLPSGAAHVLDLGAGTGKLTAVLRARHLAVTAVEPSDGMRAELERTLPDVTSLAGAAEAIPLEDASVDAVLVAQAWHWVDPARAVPEVARVLRPGGRLGLLWNRRDDREPWVAELSRLLSPLRTGDHPGDARTEAQRVVIGAPFGEPERFDTEPWSHPLTPEGVLDLVVSRSYVIGLSAAAHEALLGRVRALLTEHPALAGRDEIAMPYVTECVRADRR